MEGYPFIWFKSLGTIRVFEEKYDRALTYDSCYNMCPNVMVENLLSNVFDHCPIFLVSDLISCNRRLHFRFKFENGWLVDTYLVTLFAENGLLMRIN